MPNFGLIIIGDEILSGKRSDKHLPKVIELLKARGLQLDWADYVGDAPDRITATLQRAFACGDIVFSCGGIGATPDDHTRQCAARALGVELALHVEAENLIRQRMQEMAAERGTAYEPDAPDNIHRLNMGVFPIGAQVVPNPFNRIPGFFCTGTTVQGKAIPPVAEDAPWVEGRGGIFFVPGFPVMAWPMIEWALDAHCSHLFKSAAWIEQSVIVLGAMEATLTPLMQEVERRYPDIKVFSLPSVDHPQYGRHIELGVKGEPALVTLAYQVLLAGLQKFKVQLGPELVQK